MQIIVYSVQVFILGKVLFLSPAFCVIYETHHCAQSASFKRFRPYSQRKEVGFL